MLVSVRSSTRGQGWMSSSAAPSLIPSGFSSLPSIFGSGRGFYAPGTSVLPLGGSTCTLDTSNLLGGVSPGMVDSYIRQRGDRIPFVDGSVLDLVVSKLSCPLMRPGAVHRSLLI